jgi:hypothetical protein
MRNIKALFLSVAALGLMSGVGFISCSNTDPKLVLPDHTPPPPVGQAPKKESAGTVLADQPKVDILFVIDDSSSMSAHQQELSANVGLFVQGFFGGSSLDYHIGVTTSSTSLEVDWPYGPYPWGDGKLMGSPSFVDRNTANGLYTLQQKMIVGIEGNGHERFFVPVQQALTEPNLSGANRGFYRPDAYLAIVMITDATDPGTVLTVQGFEAFLKGLKPGHPEKLLNYAVIIPSSLGPYPSGCDRDPDGPPTNIEQYISDMGGQSFGLCDPDFGKKLAQMGANLVSKVTFSKVVLLARKPIESTIMVKFGTQIIPQGGSAGWVYDPVKTAVILGDNIVWSKQPSGTQVEVTFTPANVLPQN